MADRQSLALAAAHQAADAAAELIRYAREGDGLQGPFEIEVTEKLADALKMAMEVSFNPKAPLDPTETQLASALERFLEGWA